VARNQPSPFVQRELDAAGVAGTVDDGTAGGADGTSFRLGRVSSRVAAAARVVRISHTK